MYHSVTMRDVIPYEHEPGKFSIFARSNLQNTANKTLSLLVTFELELYRVVIPFGDSIRIDLPAKSSWLVSSSFSPSSTRGRALLPGASGTVRVRVVNRHTDEIDTASRAVTIPQPAPRGRSCSGPSGKHGVERDEAVTVRYQCNEDFWKRDGSGYVGRRRVYRSKYDGECYNFWGHCSNPNGTMDEWRSETQEYRLTCNNGVWEVSDYEEYFATPHGHLIVKDRTGNEYRTVDSLNAAGVVHYFPLGSYVSGADLFYDGTHRNYFYDSRHNGLQRGSNGGYNPCRDGNWSSWYLGLYYEVKLNGRRLLVVQDRANSTSRERITHTHSPVYFNSPDEGLIPLDEGDFDVRTESKDFKLSMETMVYQYRIPGLKVSGYSYSENIPLFEVTTPFRIELMPTLYVSGDVGVDLYVDGECVGENPHTYVPFPKILENETRLVTVSATPSDILYTHTVLMQGDDNTSTSIALPDIIFSDITCSPLRQNVVPYKTNITPVVVTSNRRSTSTVSGAMRYKIVDTKRNVVFETEWQKITQPKSGTLTTQLPTYSVDKTVTGTYTAIIEIQEGSVVSSQTKTIDILPLPKFEILSTELKLDRATSQKDAKELHCGGEMYLIRPDSDIEIVYTIRRTDTTNSDRSLFGVLAINDVVSSVDEIVIPKRGEVYAVTYRISTSNMQMGLPDTICLTFE